MKDKGNQKKSQFVISKNCEMEKKLYAKIKNIEHVKYLNKRMEWWKHRKLEELISRV